MITLNFNFSFASSLNELPVGTNPFTSTFSYGSWGSATIKSCASKSGAYAFSFIVGDYSYVGAISSDNSTVWYYANRSNVSTSYTLNKQDYLSGNLYYQYNSENTSRYSVSLNDSLGTFDTFANAMQYVESIYNGTLNPPSISKYTFQNGWLSVIDLGASNTAYNFDLFTSFNVNSGLVSQNWSETSQTYWFSNSLPSVESTYTNQGTLIPWERGTPRNVFGQTKDGIYNLSGTSTGRYLYILNPAFRTIADAEHPSIENHSVTVDGLTNGMKAYVYELTATATLSGVANAISTIEVDGQIVIANSGSVTAGDTSEDLTNSFVNSDNETIIQNQGGGNQNTTAQTINNYLENIQNVLDNFVNQFVGLLTAPISHIQQLVSAGTSFFSVFGQLFSTWLPADVSSVIISALVVMIVIGVIKMLL